MFYELSVSYSIKTQSGIIIKMFTFVYMSTCVTACPESDWCDLKIDLIGLIPEKSILLTPHQSVGIKTHKITVLNEGFVIFV